MPSPDRQLVWVLTDPSSEMKESPPFWLATVSKLALAPLSHRKVNRAAPVAQRRPSGAPTHGRGQSVELLLGLRTLQLLSFCVVRTIAVLTHLNYRFHQISQSRVQVNQGRVPACAGGSGACHPFLCRALRSVPDCGSAG